MYRLIEDEYNLNTEGGRGGENGFLLVESGLARRARKAQREDLLREPGALSPSPPPFLSLPRV